MEDFNPKRHFTPTYRGVFDYIGKEARPTVGYADTLLDQLFNSKTGGDGYNVYKYDNIFSNRNYFKGRPKMKVVIPNSGLMIRDSLMRDNINDYGRYMQESILNRAYGEPQPDMVRNIDPNIKYSGRIRDIFNDGNKFRKYGKGSISNNKNLRSLMADAAILDGGTVDESYLLNNLDDIRPYKNKMSEFRFPKNGLQMLYHKIVDDVKHPSRTFDTFKDVANRDIKKALFNLSRYDVPNRLKYAIKDIFLDRDIRNRLLKNAFKVNPYIDVIQTLLDGQPVGKDSDKPPIYPVNGGLKGYITNRY